MKLKKIIISILIPVAVGIIVGAIISPFMDYKSLELPPLSPPSIAFPIAWTILYTLMGISAYLISKTDKVPSIYYIQLFVNALWSIIFFVFKWRLLAFFWILLLIALVIVMIVKFFKINKGAAYLQIPYLLWLLFAAYLNIGIYILN